MKNAFESQAIANELLWVRLGQTAAQEFETGRFDASTHNWEKACRLAQEFGEGDPRLASSLNNMSICFRIGADLNGAEIRCRRALAGWEAALKWIETIRFTARARSSLFHLRLERKHGKHMDRIRLAECRRLVVAGMGATLANLGELAQTRGRRGEAEELYRQAIESRSVAGLGTGRIRKNLEGLSGAATSPDASPDQSSDVEECATLLVGDALPQGWVIDNPPRFTDEGRLMAAVRLAWIVDHSVAPSYESMLLRSGTASP